MPSSIIQWFPGHMAKTRRLITENLHLVDLVIEVRDARIPLSSANPELTRLVGSKPVLTVFSKCSLADPSATDAWRSYFRKSGKEVLFIDSVTGAGIRDIKPTIDRMLADRVARNESRGMTGKTLKAMIVGIPNVGKSCLINKISASKKAKVENRPGVTLTKQWVTTTIGLDLMDMPGVLWPKFEDQTVGENLAICGSIKDDVLDPERMALAVCNRMRRLYPEQFAARFRLTPEEVCEKETDDYDLFLLIGRRRGLLRAGGVVDEERCAAIIVDEFRSGKIGRVTVEHPCREEKTP